MACTFFYFLLASKWGVLDVFDLEKMDSAARFPLFFIALGMTGWGFVLIVSENDRWVHDWRLSTVILLFYCHVAVFVIAFLVESFGIGGGSSYSGECVEVGRYGQLRCY